jgi:putative copper export protein
VAWGLLLALAGAGGSFLLLAARGGTGPAAAFDPQAWRAALGGRPGAITAVVGALVAYALWILARPRARAWALAPLGVAVLATAWRGHPGVAAEAGRWWEAVANGLHVAGATLWVGALTLLRG